MPDVTELLQLCTYAQKLEADIVIFAEEEAKKLTLKLRQTVRFLRQGPKELVATFIALLLFAAPKILPKLTLLVPEELKPLIDRAPLLLYITAGIIFSWVVYRFWKLAVPAALPEEETRPAAIKGPMALGPQDGELFRRLGREDELAQLHSWVLDDQIPLIVLMGESGAGKTSLLRAGLSNLIKEMGIHFVYWEAIPTRPAERLLYAIQQSWSEEMNFKPPEKLEDLLSADRSASGSMVIMLDQFEQLRPDDAAHQQLFDMLRQVAIEGV